MERPLPHDLNAEKALLGACLLDRDAILAVRYTVSVEDFYLEKHAWVYEAMITCVTNRVPPDLATVASELRRCQQLDTIGGVAYLTELATGVPSAVHVEYYAEVVSRTAAHRRLIELGGKIASAGYDESRNLDELYQEMEQRLNLQRRATTNQQHWHDHIDGAVIWQNEYEPCPFIVEGIIPQGSLLLAGKPKTKKSWLALNIAYAVAAGGKALGRYQALQGEVLYIDLEMGDRRMHKRLHTLFPEAPPVRGVQFVRSWAKIWQGFEQQLATYLDERPFTRLVIVDTLVGVRPPRPRDADPYEHEKMYAQTLSDFCQSRSIAMICIHHARKADAADVLDAASGTTGLTGGFDNVGILRPGKETGTGVLDLIGRDVEIDDPLNLKWDARLAQWNATDERVGLSDTRRQVLSLLVSHRSGLTARQIAALLERDEPGTRRLLSDMLRDGQVCNAQGLYRLQATPSA